MQPDWGTNGLLEDLAERCLPSFLDYERTHWAENGVSSNSVFWICKGFLIVPWAFVDKGIRCARYLCSLLESLDNLH